MKKFKNNLSRNEMKTIFAGSNGGGTVPISQQGGHCDACSSHSDCASGVCATWSTEGACPIGRRCL